MYFSRELNPLAELERHIQNIEDIFQVVSTLIELLDLGQGTPEVLLPDDACKSLPRYLVPSSRGQLLVITMIIFLHAFRSLAEPHSSVSVQFVMALMSSSHHGLRLFLVPPPIPNIIDFSKLFFLRMICPKYDSCCFFINASSGW